MGASSREDLEPVGKKHPKDEEHRPRRTALQFPGFPSSKMPPKKLHEKFIRLSLGSSSFFWPLAIAGVELAHVTPAEAVITLRVEQIGSDVHVIGSGKANLNALNFAGSEMKFQNVLTEKQIFAGASVFSGGGPGNTGIKVDLYDNILTGPTTVSSDQDVTEEPDPVLSSGDLFGILTSPYTLALPMGYVSNTPLNGVSIYKNLTLAQLGLGVCCP